MKKNKYTNIQDIVEDMSSLENDYNKYIFDEDEDDFIHNILLYFICKKCKEDNFDLTEYVLCEIPFQNDDGEIWCFCNKKENHAYHTLNEKQTKISGIDFFVYYDGAVDPLYLNYDKNKGFHQIQKKTCQEAVSYEGSEVQK